MATNAAAPWWFEQACSRPHRSATVEVGGARINHVVWDPPTPTGEPPVVLVHGTSAHAHWWTHLAGLLAADRRVTAVDLSGHGDSSHRDSYDTGTWAAEVSAVAASVDEARQGVCVVGHSLGGIAGAVAAARRDHPIVGLALCETMRDSNEPFDARGITHQERRYSATREEAVARFRLAPRQEHALPYVLDHLARHSVTEQPEGWTWKSDVNLALRLSERLPLMDDVLTGARCPVALIRTEHGFLRPDEARRMAAAVAGPVETITLAGVGHHPMADAPLTLLATVRLLLERWSRIPVEAP